MNKNISPITFIDRLVKKNELGQDFKLTDDQREILRLAFAFDENGRLPWDTIIYSCVKKSGKTTINGAVTLAWGFTQEAPNEILVLANDLEQTLARVFNTMEGIIKFNPELQREAEVQSRTIYLANGTTITAISGDYQGAAGSNHGLVSYDELWGYTSESSIRLWGRVNARSYTQELNQVHHNLCRFRGRIKTAVGLVQAGSQQRRASRRYGRTDLSRFTHFCQS
jgi:phage terminase large subunit-like protein